MGNVKRMWAVAVVAALVASVPVVYFSKTIPWLIAVPIAIGVAMELILEFSRSATVSKPSQPGSLGNGTCAPRRRK